MQLYTLTKSFMPNSIVGNFVSAIWTERYSSAGDVQIVTPATTDMIDQLAEGTFLGLRGTREIMLLETQSIEQGLLTVTGKSLTQFLNARHAQFPEAAEFTLNNRSAGAFIAEVVRQIAINPIYYDEERDKLVGLELGQISTSGTVKRLSVNPGPLYEIIQKIAQEEGVGIKLYLKSAKFSTGYVLRFTTWLGKNRTSEQDTHSIVRLSPQMDSLTDIKELTSISEYKNVIYVSYEGTTSIHYTEPTLPVPEGFDRRVLQVDAPTIYIAPEHRTEFREQVARNTIAEHVYIKAVDGQVSTDIGYKYGSDYLLGDIIELEGFTGLMSKARVTEYIRSQDQFGEREYPTLSIIDPLFTGYMPDTEPSEDWDDEWDEDPETDFDFEDEIDFDDWDPEDDFDDSEFDDDFNTRRRRKRRRKKPTPLAPDPDLNPDPEDPNPDPTPDEADYPDPDPDPDIDPDPVEPSGSQMIRFEHGFINFVIDYDASGALHPAGFDYIYYSNFVRWPSWPPLKEIAPPGTTEFNLHVHCFTSIEVAVPQPQIAERVTLPQSPGDYANIHGPVFELVIASSQSGYEDIHLMVDVNDSRAVRTFDDRPFTRYDSSGNPIHGFYPLMFWEIDIDIPGKIDAFSAPDGAIITHRRWLFGPNGSYQMYDSPGTWVAHWSARDAFGTREFPIISASYSYGPQDE